MFKKDKMSNSDLNAVRSQDSGYLRDRGLLCKQMRQMVGPRKEGGTGLRH